MQPTRDRLVKPWADHTGLSPDKHRGVSSKGPTQEDTRTLPARSPGADERNAEEMDRFVDSSSSWLGPVKCDRQSEVSDLIGGESGSGLEIGLS